MTNSCILSFPFSLFVSMHGYFSVSISWTLLSTWISEKKQSRLPYIPDRQLKGWTWSSLTFNSVGNGWGKSEPRLQRVKWRIKGKPNLCSRSPLLLQAPLVYHHGYLTNFPGYFITIEMLTPLWSDQLRKSAPASTSTGTLTQPLVIFCQAVSIQRLHSKILMEHSGSAIIDVIYRITPTWIEARVMVVRELNGVASVLVSPSFCVSNSDPMYLLMKKKSWTMYCST